MKKTITKFVIALGLFAASLLCINNTEEVYAMDAELRITPTSFNYELDPGETVTGSFELKNIGDFALDYSVKASPYYTESDDKGKVDVRYDVENSYTQIADWVTFDKDSGTLGADEAVKISFVIKVPSDAPGGGQYTALLASTRGRKSENDSNKEGINVGEVTSLGPVVYAKVNGETRKTGEILKNETNGFLFNPPISVNSIVKNTGNIHTKATYIMRVYPFFSEESIYNNEDNPITVPVLPNTTRYYELSWGADQGAPSIGIFKVQSEVKIFDEVSKIEQVVIICPMWVLILISIFILAVIFWIISRAKARKAEK